jgi:cell division protein CrgA
MPKSKRRKKAAPPPPPSRYTPPKPKTAKHSALWVPSTMFACLLTGVAVIIANYLQLLPGGEAQNSYLFVGLGLLISGFVLSTQYR